MNFKRFIKNAFAIEESLTDNERQFLDELTEKIKQKKLNQILSLASSIMQPVGFIAGQFSYYAKAFLVPLILSNKEFDFFTKLMSKKKGWEYFIDKLNE
ncbi:MAG: hypothetical protein ACK4NF_03135 [Planctomycetota bacterium]